MATAKKAKKPTRPVKKKATAKRSGDTQKKTGGAYTLLIRYALAFFAVFLILTFFPQIDSGLLGGVREVLKGLFGFGYYLFPFLLLLAVFNFGSGGKRGNGAAAARNTLTVLLFLFLLCLVHLVAVRTQHTDAYGETIKSFDGLYAGGKALQTGGAVGGFLCALISRWIGWVATAILSSVGVFICAVLLCGSTPMATIRAILRFFKKLSLPDEQEEEQAEEVPAEPEAERKKPPQKEGKRKVPNVLVDDRKITDTVPTVEQSNGQHRFLTPDEEQEEVFSRVPAELFRHAKQGETDVPAPDSPVAEQAVLERTVPDKPEAESLFTPLQKQTDGISAEPEKTGEADASPEAKTETEADIPAEPLTVTPNESAPYVFPPLSLLTQETGSTPRPTAADVSTVSRKLETVLESFKVKAHVIGASFGPTVTQYEVQPETGVRVKQISNLSDDIALHLAASSVRIENIPGKSAIGIEIPNRAPSVVRLRNLIENPVFRDSKSKLITALGEDVSGNPVYLDIGKMPHLMIAGATGMGKSVCMNALIVSLLYHASPDDVKFIMIDPKKVEMADYNGIPHLLVPVINDAKKAAGTLNWACGEMEKRYNLIQEVNAKNLIEYNAIVKDDPEREQQPYIVIFIDELADLMMTAPDDVETSICRLAQKARAAGIHLVIGTQRPSVDVITGLIKANIPSRIAFTVASQVDSRTILDIAGAEKLLGRGDMLYYPVGSMKPIRVQGALVDGKTEVVAITEFIKNAASASYDETVIEEIEKEAKLCGQPKHSRRSEGGEDGEGGEVKLDEKFLEALELAIDTQNISTSMIQTRLGLGYARAARIVGVMEQKGYIGPFDSATKKRRIILTREELMEMKMGSADKGADDENA